MPVLSSEFLKRISKYTQEAADSEKGVPLDLVPSLRTCQTALRYPDWTVRTVAAKALHHFPASTQQNFQQALSDSAEPVRMAVLWHIDSTKVPIEDLVAIASSPLESLEMRYCAVHAIALYPAEESNGIILILLQTAEEPLKRQILKIIGDPKYDFQSAVDLILDISQNSVDKRTAEMAVSMLANFPEERVVQFLLGLATQPSGFSHRAAFVAADALAKNTLVTLEMLQPYPMLRDLVEEIRKADAEKAAHQQ